MPVRTDRIALTLSTILLLCLLVDLHLTSNYIGVDLRDKVIGSRSLLAGRSLYFDPWRPGDPEQFADPLVPPGSELTRFTGSPFQALITTPMTWVSFPVLRIAWLFVQYGALLLLVWLMWRAYSTNSFQDRIITAAALVVFLLSGAWRLHVERGQLYILFAVLLAGIFLTARIRSTDVTGVLGALLVLLKPTFGLLLLPLVFVLNKQMIIGGCVMLTVGLLPFFFLPGGMSSWAEYNKAMNIWSQHTGEGTIPPTDPAYFEYPATIDGSADHSSFHTMEVENGSIPTIFYSQGIVIPVSISYGLILFIMFVVAAGAWRRLKTAPVGDLLLLGFMLYIILGMLLPVVRFHYQFVLWLPPLLYVMLNWRDAPLISWIIAAFAGLLVTGGLHLLPVNILLAEFLLLGLMAWYLYQQHWGKKYMSSTDLSAARSVPSAS